MPQQRIQMQQPSAQHNAALNNNLNAGLNLIDHLIIHVYKSDPALLPQRNEIITSSHIDKFTYSIWQICLTENNGNLLTGAARTSSMFDDVKIRTLSIMNLLPSWWFMRERLVGLLNGTGRPLDDSDMEIVYGQAYATAVRVVQVLGQDRGAMRRDRGYARMGPANGPAHVKREDGFAHMSPRNGAVGMGHFDGFALRSPGNFPVRRSHIEGYTQMSPLNGSGRTGRDDGFAQMSPENGPVRRRDVEGHTQEVPHNGSVRMGQDEGFAHLSPGNASPTHKDNGDGFLQMSPNQGSIHDHHGGSLAQMSSGDVPVRMDHGNDLAQMNQDHDSFDLGNGHDFAQMAPHDEHTAGDQAGIEGEFYQDEKPSNNF
ncbi:hypothetical protein BDU57DRAFT_108782 [Ampelomyces quisqualis]|uniref:Uncharacterized protein n=1 Tax=Ampelomyces quisqualis TaxID=50730 RepID=A0A6A5Q4R3_AMPQU|nr:hypothetical protein BDU57DRAFT_108782 [Ampelomyces quisqualis]